MRPPRASRAIDGHGNSAVNPPTAGGMVGLVGPDAAASRPRPLLSSIAGRPCGSGSQAAARATSGGTWGRWQRRAFGGAARAQVSRPSASRRGFLPILRSSNPTRIPPCCRVAGGRDVSAITGTWPIPCTGTAADEEFLPQSRPSAVDAAYGGPERHVALRHQLIGPPALLVAAARTAG